MRHTNAFVKGHVGDELIFVTVTADLEHARRRHLGGLLRDLYLVLPVRAIVSPQCAQLVHATERGLIVCGAEFGTDTPARDGRTLVFQARDDVLVKLVAGNDDCVGKSSAVEYLSRLH